MHLPSHFTVFNGAFCLGGEFLIASAGEEKRPALNWVKGAGDISVLKIELSLPFVRSI